MKIRYWDCKYGNDADEINTGTENDPDYMWVYPCTHPCNSDRACLKDNKYDNAKDECELSLMSEDLKNDTSVNCRPSQ